MEEQAVEPQEDDLKVTEDTGSAPAGGKASRKEQKFSRVISAGENRYKLPGMFKDWFLDYASYVMLDRAVPYIEDGLKPV